VRRADVVAATVLLAVAALYYQQSFFVVRGFATDRLGPTFVPRLLAGALAVLALTLLARALGGRSDPTPPPAARIEVLLTILALLVGYAVVMPKLGFLLATPGFLAAVLAALGIREPLAVVGAAVGMTAILYLAFGRLLGVLLPTSPFGRV